MKYSIYTSCFNIIKNDFNYWQKTLPKWINFLNNGEKGEIIIAVNKSEDDTLNLIKNYCEKFTFIKIIETFFDYEDYAFDGKIKNSALQKSSNEICIGLDLDEYPNPDVEAWDNIALKFLNSPYDALFIPVIDLCKTEKHIKSIGIKWYMHKRGLSRGVWKYARLENGKIDTKRSDTCELLDKEGNLCKAITLIENVRLIDIEKYKLPFIIHLGWLNWEERKKQNNTWQPVWTNRAGFEIKDIIHEKQNFEDIKVYEHNLSI